MEKRSQTNAADAIKEMRELLADWLDASDKASKPVAKMMRLLEVVADELQRSGGRPSPRGRDERRYTVENTSSGPVLTEGKSGGTPPFRVPKTIYDSVANVLAGDNDALTFEEILDQASKKATVPPGDHHVRVCLRFWLSAKPPLVSRSRSQYHPADPKKFASAASSLWNSLVESSKG